MVAWDAHLKKAVTVVAHLPEEDKVLAVVADPNLVVDPVESRSGASVRACRVEARLPESYSFSAHS